MLVYKEINVWCPTFNKKLLLNYFYFSPNIHVYICIIVYTLNHIYSYNIVFIEKLEFSHYYICLAPYTRVAACIYGSPIYTDNHLFRVSLLDLLVQYYMYLYIFTHTPDTISAIHSC